MLSEYISLSPFGTSSWPPPPTRSFSKLCNVACRFVIAVVLLSPLLCLCYGCGCAKSILECHTGVVQRQIQQVVPPYGGRCCLVVTRIVYFLMIRFFHSLRECHSGVVQHRSITTEPPHQKVPQRIITRKYHTRAPLRSITTEVTTLPPLRSHSGEPHDHCRKEVPRRITTT